MVCRGKVLLIAIEKNGVTMKQTPLHDQHNPDLLRLIPSDAARLIEIGCSSGALAREFRKINPKCHYVGLDIDASYVDVARANCNEVIVADFESVGTEFFERFRDRDCWIFGDSLEHFRDPWSVLANVRRVAAPHACVVACIPNAQHWSMFARVAVGDLRYQDSGLMDRTHLRWFSRQTIIELFDRCGFRLVEGMPRIFHEPQRDAFLENIAEVAKLCGVDPDMARNDAMPLQYVVRAVPL